MVCTRLWLRKSASAFPFTSAPGRLRKDLALAIHLRQSAQGDAVAGDAKVSIVQSRKALAAIVHRAMAPSPSARFGSAATLRDALLPYCGSLSMAGRLAATPLGETPAPGGGVAPTWPPDDEAGARDRPPAGPSPAPTPKGPAGHERLRKEV